MSEGERKNRLALQHPNRAFRELAPEGSAQSFEGKTTTRGLPGPFREKNQLSHEEKPAEFVN